MLYLYYSIVSLCYLVFMGIGLTYLIVPKQVSRYTIIISPIVGYGLTTLFAWYCYIADLPGANVYAWFSLVFGLSINIYAYKRYRSFKLPELEENKPDWIPPILMGCIAFLVINIPFIITPNSPTTMSIANNDIVDYAAMSRFIQEFPRSTTEGFLGQCGVVHYNCDVQWFGVSAITAFFASLLRTDAYRVQSLCVNLFFALGVPLCYMFSREILKVGRRFSMCIAFFYAIHPVLYRVAYDGFHGQLSATTIITGLAAISIMCIETPQWKERLKYLGLLVVCKYSGPLQSFHIFYTRNITIWRAFEDYDIVNCYCLRS